MMCTISILCTGLTQTLVANVSFISAEENYHPAYEKKQQVYIYIAHNSSVEKAFLRDSF